MMRLAFLGVVAAAPALADDLRPVPDYYADALFAVSMVESLSAVCPEVEPNVTGIGVHIAGVNTLLVKDGFAPNRAIEQMDGFTEALQARRTAFLARHPGIEGAEAGVICDVAARERADETLIGRMMTDTD